MKCIYSVNFYYSITALGHVRRKDGGYIGRRMLRMELPGKRKRGRPKRRFIDVVKQDDMAEVEVTEYLSRIQKIGTTGNGKSAVATPDGEKQKEEEQELLKNTDLGSIYIFGFSGYGIISIVHLLRLPALVISCIVAFPMVTLLYNIVMPLKAKRACRIP